jgi:predicted nucleic acid-binding protein
MADPFKKPYLDSSVFLALVKREEIPCPGGLVRWQIAERILEDAASGEYNIFTSTATIAEVRRVRRQDQPLAADELRLVQEFFQHEYIQTIDVTREIAEKAQELGATYGITTIDAIHLSTAIWWECDVLLVWDKRFSLHFEDGPVEGVTVVEPYWEGQLPGP